MPPNECRLELHVYYVARQAANCVVWLTCCLFGYFFVVGLSDTSVGARRQISDDARDWQRATLCTNIYAVAALGWKNKRRFEFARPSNWDDCGPLLCIYIYINHWWHIPWIVGVAHTRKYKPIETMNFTLIIQTNKPLRTPRKNHPQHILYTFMRTSSPQWLLLARGKQSCLQILFLFYLYEAHSCRDACRSRVYARVIWTLFLPSRAPCLAHKYIYIYIGFPQGRSNGTHGSRIEARRVSIYKCVVVHKSDLKLVLFVYMQ